VSPDRLEAGESAAATARRLTVENPLLCPGHLPDPVEVCRMVSRFAAALPLLLAALAPSVAHAADTATGARLARQWCANCHVIDGTGAAGTVAQGPPSFRTIAGRVNAGALRAFLSHPHGQMPDLTLSRAEIDDLIAYIESLR
jgi:cytochrome c